MRFINELVVCSVIAITSSSVLAQSTAVQWTTASGGNGHWYQLHPKVGDWFACRSAAQGLGGDLATPSTAAENAFIEPLVPIQQFPIWNRVFLGARQRAGGAPTEGWYWVDGSSWFFTDWQWNQPNGGEGFLVAIRDENGCTWDDYGVDSTDIYFFLTEWSADCNNDGIVDKGQILNGQLIDANSNGIPDSCEIDPCPGDISGNNAVDGVDLSVLLGVWGTDGSGGEFDADVTNDGIVNGADLTIILGGWGPCPN